MSSDEAPDPQGAATPDPDSDHDGTIGSRGRRIIGACTVITAIVGASGLLLGFWQDLFGHDEKGSTPQATALPTASSATLAGNEPPDEAGSPPQCAPSRSHNVVVKLTEKPTSSAAHLIATVKCVVGLGEHLSWVVRKETGDPPRVHYTLRFDLGQQGPGQYPYDSKLDTTDPGSKRTMLVVLMDDATYRAVASTRDGDDYVQMPSPLPLVSNPVVVTTPE